MSSDLLANLQLDSKSTCNIVAIKETKNCDSSFIISSLLSSWTKNKQAVLIVSTHNSLLHYQHVGLKMSYNFQKCIESGLITFYNLGEEMVSSLILNEQYSLEQPFSKIITILQQMHEAFESINIIFDGLSHLFDLNFTVNNINMFCNNVIKFSQNVGCSSIFFHCNVAGEDDMTFMLANLLMHKASTVLEIEHLHSGLSADVSGHLIIKYPKRKFQEEYMSILEQRPTKYLFKLYDRGVKLFAPGTV